jgi:hypothetical protein
MPCACSFGPATFTQATVSVAAGNGTAGFPARGYLQTNDVLLANPLVPAVPSPVVPAASFAFPPEPVVPPPPRVPAPPEEPPVDAAQPPRKSARETLDSDTLVMEPPLRRLETPR